MTTVHYGFMPDIELTGPDTARGVWSLHDYLEWPEPIESYRGIAVPGMRAIRGCGYYEEHIGGWDPAQMGDFEPASGTTASRSGRWSGPPPPRVALADRY